MLVFCTFVNVKVCEELGTELVLGKHTLNYATEKFVCTIGLSHDAGRSVFALTTRITSVSKIDAICPLLTSELDLVGIDNDNVVAAVYVRSKIGFVLTAQQFGNFCAKTTEQKWSCNLKCPLLFVLIVTTNVYLLPQILPNHYTLANRTDATINLRIGWLLWPAR